MDIGHHNENTDENQKEKTNFIQMKPFECNSILINLGYCLEVHMFVRLRNNTNQLKIWPREMKLL